MPALGHYFKDKATRPTHEEDPGARWIRLQRQMGCSRRSSGACSTAPLQALELQGEQLQAKAA